MTITLHHGDCIDILQTLESESVDCVITDPPYPMIKRAYGMLTVDQWWALMMGVCTETRRILKPTGSAVFILQPNSEHVGQMRGWLFEFQAWVCREWNMVQDVWWWNYTPFPTVFCHREYGLMRQSVKACIWAGDPKCYRNQDAILWGLSDATKAIDFEDRAIRTGASGPKATMRPGRAARVAHDRGGSTPINLIPISNTNSDAHSSAGANGHGAGTPLKLADWWVRYICPPGGTVLDPFVGSGTMMLAAIQNGCNGIGIEKFPEADREVNDKDNPDYFGIAQGRVKHAQNEMIQLEMV